MISADDDPRIGEVIAERLTLLGLLGSGGMGSVYRALQHSMGREVAVKLLHRRDCKDLLQMKRFEQEAREASSLNQPNIVTLFDFGRSDSGELFYSMELLKGKTLRQLLLEEGTFDVDRAIAIACQICDALNAAHSAQLIHRDLKPENIVIVEGAGHLGEFIKVIDFGIAKMQVDARGFALTGQNVILGTPQYMSPEQAMGADIDGRSDLYSVALMLYEMLTGSSPFVCKTPMQYLLAHIQDSPPSAREKRADLPRSIDALLMRTLSKSPNDRPETAVDLKAALNAVVNNAAFGRAETIRSDAPLPPGRTNLPSSPARFIGRKHDLQALNGLIDSGFRLVTLHGQGGIGKTRLAIQFGWQRLNDFLCNGGGVWFCDLTEASSLDGVCHDVARGIGVPLAATQREDEPIRKVGRALAAKGKTLVILDNFEQVALLAGQTIGQWLQQAPLASFLITSRQRLGLEGEHVHEVSPLELPKDGFEIARTEAVELFVDRARAVRQGYELTDSDELVVGEIVRHLDGLPLAIELAAARSGMLGVSQMLERLNNRFKLLARTQGSKTDRQATLRRTIDWSWSLLEPAEQSALAQLSVFHGFTLEAAEDVIRLDGFSDEPWIVDVVQNLRDKSLIRAYESPEFPGELRLGLYESIREFAREKLSEMGDEEEVCSHHSRYFIQTCKQWANDYEKNGSNAPGQRLSLELGNLVSIFKWSIGQHLNEPKHTRTALEALLVMSPILLTRGPFKVHLRWFVDALDESRIGGVDWEILARAFIFTGNLAVRSHTPNIVISTLTRALHLAKVNNDRHTWVYLAQILGRNHAIQGDIDEAKNLVEQAGYEMRMLDDLRLQFEVVKSEAFILYYGEKIGEAANVFEECIDLAQKLGDDKEVLFNTFNVSDCCLILGQYDKALEFVEKTYSLCPKVDSLIFLEQHCLGVIAFIQGKHHNDPDSVTKLKAWIAYTDQQGFIDQQMDSRQYLVEVLEHHGRLKEALNVVKELKDLAEDTCSKIQQMKIEKLFDRIDKYCRDAPIR